MKVTKITTSVLALIAISASASAVALDFDGVYVVGGVGVAAVNDSQFSDSDDGENTSGIFIPGLEASADFAWRAGVGIWLLDHFAIEANYMGMSNQTDTTQGTVSGDHYNAKVETSSLNFWDLTGLGRFFIADDLWLFGRAGIGYADRVTVEHFSEDAGLVLIHNTDDDGGLGLALAVGGQYDVNEWLGLRLEANTIQGLNQNIMYAATGNFVISFGELM